MTKVFNKRNAKRITAILLAVIAVVSSISPSELSARNSAESMQTARTLTVWSRDTRSIQATP